MKAKNFIPFNMRTHESLREETCGATRGNGPRCTVADQSGSEARLRLLQVTFGVRTFGATNNY
jgi:hypothetical protein